MKIVFFGTPDFAANALKELSENKEIDILAVITQTDKAVGRHQELSSPAIKNLAESLGLKIFQPNNKQELLKICQNLKADFFVVIAYGMILPKEVLQIPKHGCINVHASLLPKYRGASPIQEALLHGDQETGISIMEMGKKLDHGDIYLIRRIQIYPQDNYISLAERMAEIASQMLPHTLEDIKTGILRKIPQDESHQKPSYCHKITKNNGEIKAGQTAEQIINMLRAYTPWPGVYINFQGKRLKILEAKLGNENLAEKFSPGSLILDQKELKLITKEGIIIPDKVQLEGKKPMTQQEFINGNKNKL